MIMSTSTGWGGNTGGFTRQDSKSSIKRKINTLDKDNGSHNQANISANMLSPSQKASLGASMITAEQQQKNPVFVRKIIQKVNTSNRDVVVINPKNIDTSSAYSPVSEIC